MLNTTGGIHEIPLVPPVVPGATPGRLWLCGKHHIAPDPEAVLADTGADLVVCHVHREELIGRYDDYVNWLEKHRDTRALWYPVHDMGAPDDLDDAMQMWSRLASGLWAGRSMVVHCAAGIGRAGSTAIAVLMVLGADLDIATGHVRRHRPAAGPQTHGQELMLEEVRRRLRR
jgi:protein-tyrosine phosphatase